MAKVPPSRTPGTERKYSSYWEGTSKSRKELEVARDLIAAMQQRSDIRFDSPRPGPDPKDPPDCIARDSEGRLVALEVTELVSQEAVRHNQKAAKLDDMAYWDPRPVDIRAKITERLASKDGKDYKGGPYAGVVVILHTDEFVLDAQRLSAVLGAEAFGPFKTLTDAYVLVSRRPHEKLCQYVRIQLAAAERL